MADYSKMTPPEVWKLIRTGEITRPTAGMCAGYAQANLVILPKKYADDFKESIQYKVNIKIEENKFHENVPAPRIVIRSDADRRSAM